jgi:DNA-directed RNA polymerase subunit omega
MESKGNSSKELKGNLTNEAIKKRFDNQFDLVNYAIGIAKEMILAGRGPRVKTQTENPALQVLEEIVAGKDIFEEKVEKVPVYRHVVTEEIKVTLADETFIEDNEEEKVLKE